MQLVRCLKALQCLNYPRDLFEVIIVDDGSDISAASQLETFRDTLNIVLVEQANAGAASARNAGAARARGRFLVFTDDDCVPAPDLLCSLAQQFARTSDCLVGGKIVNGLPDNSYSEASQLLLDYLYFYYNPEQRGATFLASMNMAMLLERFLDLGGFDTQFTGAGGEDREFCDRWLAAGWSMLYSPGAKIIHWHDLNVRSFWRQHFNYGKGGYRFGQCHKILHGERVRIEGIGFYAGMLMYPLRRLPITRALLICPLIWISQAANVLGYLTESYSGRSQVFR